MTRDQINAFCANLPGAEQSDPFGGGHDVWKVGDKSFVFMGVKNEGLSLKCADAETAALLIDMGRAQKAPYLTRGGWVFFGWNAIDDAEMRERLTTSYLTVRRSLTKKAQAALGPEPALP